LTLLFHSAPHPGTVVWRVNAGVRGAREEEDVQSLKFKVQSEEREFKVESSADDRKFSW